MDKMKETLELLGKLTVGEKDEQWKAETAYRNQNRKWLEKSARIAIRVLRLLDENNLTQRDLALKMGVSPQQVNKLLKGRENLTLETITRLEEVLGVALVSITVGEEAYDEAEAPGGKY